MLCDIYVIVEKGRVYVVDKMNIECWDLYMIYMYKQDLALNNLQELIFHKPPATNLFGMVPYIITIKYHTIDNDPNEPLFLESSL